jgi:hypothetical protein
MNDVCLSDWISHVWIFSHLIFMLTIELVLWVHHETAFPCFPWTSFHSYEIAMVTWTWFVSDVTTGVYGYQIAMVKIIGILSDVTTEVRMVPRLP